MGEGMKNDGTLLAEYHSARSEESFRELFSRHAPMVYSSALRQTGRAVLAEEVTQAVFGVLAQKAGQLRSHPVVSGWLHQTTRFAALRAVRSEQRRQIREQEASRMNDSTDETDRIWAQLEPHLDEAMGSLGESDRDALILRYFENRSLREVGERIGVTDDAAQKRVSRALEKLRRFFDHRKLGLSTGVIAAALPGNAIGAVPATLAQSLPAAVIAGGSAPATLELIQETMNLLFWTKLKTAAPIALIGAVAVGTPITVQHNTIADLRQENAELRAQLAALQSAPKQVVAAKPVITATQLEKIRADAAEVHRLRADIARTRDAAVAESARVRQAEAATEKAQRQIAKATQAKMSAQRTLAKDREKKAIELMVSDSKRLGLAFNIAKSKGGIPRSFEEFVEHSNFPPDKVEQMRNRLLFFDHGADQHGTVNGFRIVMADRQPKVTIDGEQLWFYTMEDGSVMTMREPPPADGILRRNQ